MEIPCFEQVSDVTDFDEIIQVLYSVLYFRTKHGINRAINYPVMIMDNFLFTETVEKYKIAPNLSVMEIFDRFNDEEIEFEDSDIFKRRYRMIKELHEIANELSPTQVIENLYEVYASEPFAKSKKAKEKLESMQNLLEVAKDFEEFMEENNNPPLRAFLDYISLSSNEDTGKNDSGDAVNLMTCHKSKGLEFPVVFIPGVQVGMFPNGYFIKTKEQLEAERRLFYVSMTRAINKLYITCHADPFEGDGGIIKKGFLAEIPGIKF
jgi:DNA helicase-2/ATP-dependent DNA helicase PcrA